MQEYWFWMVEYKIGKVEIEICKQLKPGERKLVLVAHDEPMMQANDGEKAGWVLDGEQPLKKKGVGRGLHQSDIICLTYGWLKGASVSLEYGRIYDGYWNGELFVKQVCNFTIQSFFSVIQISYSFMRRSYQNLNGCVVQSIKSYLWLIIHRAMLHTPMMLC